MGDVLKHASDERILSKKKNKINKIQVSQRIARKGQPNEQWVKHLTDIFQEIYGRPTNTGENGPMRWLSG